MVVAFTLGACGGGSAQEDGGVDAGHQVDGGVADAGPDALGPCDVEGFTVVDQTAEATSSDFYYQGFSSATEPSDVITVELYYGLGGAEPLMGPGSVTLGAAADDRNYATCSTCVLVWTDCDSTGSCNGPTFFATEGTLDVTALATGGSFTGTLTSVRLVEVEIDPTTYLSTPVADGQAWCVASLALGAPVQGSLPCSSSTACAANAAAPHCDLDTNACVQCLEEAHCAALTATPHCDPATSACAECVTDAHCASSAAGAFCVSGLCGACGTDFDCAGAAAPVCAPSATTYRTECVAGGTCVGDDASEEADDGPAGARAIAAGSPLAGKVCDAARESDYFAISAGTTGDLTFTLTWTISNSSNPEDLDLYVYDAGGTLLGMAENGAGTETVALTYLAAGTYYAQVVAYSMGTASGAISYTLGAAAAASACAADADCAATFANQYLRGTCAAGACVPIAGAGALAAGAACDSVDDCASGLCTYGYYESDGLTYFIDYSFVADADTRGYCVADFCAADADCVSPEVCSLGFCLPPCTESAQCPLAGPGSTTSVDGWTHATCNPSTGACEF
jgi:hypothetical protein